MEGQAGFTTSAGFAANGYGEHSPGNYAMLSGFVAEVVLTFFFLVIILGGGLASVVYPIMAGPAEPAGK